MRESPAAVVLLSGGLDSATALALAVSEGLRPIALTFRYGQRHAQEVEAARAVARAAGVAEHVVVEIDLRAFGGSALTADVPVPKDRELRPGADAAPAPRTEIPVTYVPARNTIFLAYALALAEVRDAGQVVLGVNVVDYSGYPDCRPEFIAAFERVAELGTRAGVCGRPIRIRAPLLHLTKAEIVRRGLALGVDYSLTRSCYDPDHAGRPCARCDSCRLRAAAFAELGMTDPAG